MLDSDSHGAVSPTWMGWWCVATTDSGQTASSPVSINAAPPHRIRRLGTRRRANWGCRARGKPVGPEGPEGRARRGRALPVGADLRIGDADPDRALYLA